MAETALKEDRLNAVFEKLQLDIKGLTLYSYERDFALERLSQRATKKARYHRPQLRRDALEKFLRINETVGLYKCDSRHPIIQEMRYFITRAFLRYTGGRYGFEEGCISLGSLFDRWGFGPGASVEVRGTHTAEKLGQPFTTTGPCVHFVDALLDTNPYLSSLRCEPNGGIKVVKGNKLSFVPKNDVSVRTIATEPSGNMAAQLALGRYIEDVLRSIGLDIRKQSSLNNKLAKAGSETGHFCTLDLSSASDMFSPKLLAAVFPKEVYSLMLRFRSPVTTLPGGQIIDLEMMSTMGNGFTFPMMTLTLTALIYAVRRIHFGGPLHYVDWSVTGVFGDDLICQKHEFDAVVQAIELCGLVVNVDKSYSEGSFRESCGGDYLRGYDVTPFYIKTLDTEADIYVALNQVLDYCGKHEIMFPRTVKYLLSLLENVYIVPEWLDPSQGLLHRDCSRRYKYLKFQPVRRILRSESFLSMLACGGYVSGGRQVTFVPRTRGAPKFKTCRARLPSGYLDGRAAEKRTPSQALHISLLLEIANS